MFKTAAPPPVTPPEYEFVRLRELVRLGLGLNSNPTTKTTQRRLTVLLLTVKLQGYDEDKLRKRRNTGQSERHG
jgi:hypothetical protein